MKVIIDEDKCVGAGQCVLAAAEVFDQREDDGIVVLLDALRPRSCTPRWRTPRPVARRWPSRC